MKRSTDESDLINMFESTRLLLTMSMAFLSLVSVFKILSICTRYVFISFDSFPYTAYGPQTFIIAHFRLFISSQRQLPRDNKAMQSSMQGREIFHKLKNKVEVKEGGVFFYSLYLILNSNRICSCLQASQLNLTISPSKSKLLWIASFSLKYLNILS